MLFVPRIHQEASNVPDQNSDRPSSPFLYASLPREEQKRAEKRARAMLLVHQSGSVKVGQVIRYAVLCCIEYTVTMRLTPNQLHSHLRARPRPNPSLALPLARQNQEHLGHRPTRRIPPRSLHPARSNLPFHLQSE